jgi:hypothetical protein
MQQREAKSSILFRHWIKANPQFSSAWENKDTRGKSSLPFSEVSQAQLDYGMAIKGPKGVLLRVQAVAEGMPDYVYLRNAPSWIIVKYPSAFEIIDVETFIMEKKRSKSKSLSHQRAREISTISVKTKTG